jgi:hypothetical protein
LYSPVIKFDSLAHDLSQLWQLSVQLDFDHVGASPAVEVDTVMSHEVLNTKF